MRRDWTPKMIATLTELWSTKLSCADIAWKMGDDLTKAAIIGKAFRLGLPPRKPIVRSRPPGPKKRKPKPRRRIVQPVAMPEFVVLEARAEPWRPLPGSTPISLMDLTDRVCRWPVGGDHQTPGIGFCGSPVMEGRSYCPEHYAASIGKGTSFERAAIKVAKTMVRHERVTEAA
jgi:GcrA cell cycle regulator